MSTLLQRRLLGAQILALLVTFVGEFLGVSALVAVGVSGFFLALFGLFAAMSVALAAGLRRTPGPAMCASTADVRG